MASFIFVYVNINRSIPAVSSYPVPYFRNDGDANEIGIIVILQLFW